MKKRITALLFVLICASMLAGCGKNIDTMTDEEVYDYLCEMTEDELMEATSNMTEEQQRRASMILMLKIAQTLQDRDDFEEELLLPEYENTEETEIPRTILDALHE